MRNEYSAFAADFYINQRLNLKMDLSMRRDTVLSLGGSRHPLEVFRAFRGRDPDPLALLRQCGLA